MSVPADTFDIAASAETIVRLIDEVLDRLTEIRAHADTLIEIKESEAGTDD